MLYPTPSDGPFSLRMRGVHEQDYIAFTFAFRIVFVLLDEDFLNFRYRMLSRFEFGFLIAIAQLAKPGRHPTRRCPSGKPA